MYCLSIIYKHCCSLLLRKYCKDIWIRGGLFIFQKNHYWQHVHKVNPFGFSASSPPPHPNPFAKGRCIPTTQTQANTPPPTLYSESEVLAVSSYLSRVGVKPAPKTEKGWFHFPEWIAALQPLICSSANIGWDGGAGKQEDSFSNIWAVGNRWTIRDPKRQFTFAFFTLHWRMLKLPSLNFSYL